ncbi:substrate-binding domain-containing protein [Streptomyces sp. NPDC012510]|uniref:substrate-binding domain-containing protein n=1 Tax=Streptomyces sp. NPDC012510 TaxID=3364838 RepID=UPI0036F17F08
MAEFFERLPARRNADALLVFCFDLTKEETTRLDDLSMPVISISQHVEGRPSVYVDDVSAACKATRHLINLGHRRIAFAHTVNARGFTFSSRERLLGYRQALTEADIPLDDDLVVTTPPRDKRGTTQAIGSLLSLREPPTAIFAEQDELAAAVVSALRTVQVEVPERISVLGFDDQLMAEWLDLSTVAQSPSDMGRAAVRTGPGTHQRSRDGPRPAHRPAHASHSPWDHSPTACYPQRPGKRGGAFEGHRPDTLTIAKRGRNICVPAPFGCL